ncbi:MAG: MATE family efflux transporter [Flavonifractor plautii]
MFSKQALRRLILPLIIEQFLAVMVGMADIMMVSSAGEAAVSSVALVDLINVLIINIFAALATGGAVVCAQSIGAQNLERANRAANQLLYIVTAAALGIMVLVLFCKAEVAGPAVRPSGAGGDGGAVTYFVISALSYPFIAVYNGCAALSAGHGQLQGLHVRLRLHERAEHCGQRCLCVRVPPGCGGRGPLLPAVPHRGRRTHAGPAPR